jgi:hypothetical protein
VVAGSVSFGGGRKAIRKITSITSTPMPGHSQMGSQSGDWAASHCYRVRRT